MQRKKRERKMDAAKKKALFRAKLNAQKKNKRIDSPLVRYNEADQPVCRVCNVTLKSESQWDAHQASRKHREAINNIKANAAGRTQVPNVKPESRADLSGLKQAHKAELQDTEIDSPEKLPKPQSSSVLPPNFFDNNETKNQKPETLSKPLSSSVLPPEFFDNHETKRQKKEILSKPQSSSVLPPDFFDNDATKQNFGSDAVKSLDLDTQKAREFARMPTENTGPESKQVKGALPEGFFDNKEADLRARGIKLVKPDVKDEYKEFEKLIQEDLREVDDRLEEEEIDAAEMIEEAETLEQKVYRGKVELLRKKKMELMAARSAKLGGSSGIDKESNHEESSSDEDSDENFAVDWRAQHL